MSWALSTALDTTFCTEALDKALKGGKPQIFNTDQGSQFTSGDFTGRLEDAKVQISMDGRGRVFDNIFTERFWRTLKYEEVYLNEYDNLLDAKAAIKAYIRFYNEERLHQSLEYRTPAEVYFVSRVASLELCGAPLSDAADTPMGVSVHEGLAFHLKEPEFWS